MAANEIVCFGRNFKDITGLKFGKLLVVEPDGRNKHGKLQWLCRCKCGNPARATCHSLMSGNVRSCGCLIKECASRMGLSQRRHGFSPAKGRTPEYRTWRGMIGRCHNSKNKDYPRYGGRGIFVCQRWRDDFVNFLSDMGRRPSDKHSIDRIDNDRCYEPGNCRWSLLDEQAWNKRNTVRLTYGDRTLTVAEWSKEVGIGVATIKSRVFAGSPTERALTQAVDTRRLPKARR